MDINESQKRHLETTFKSIDKMLAEMELVLSSDCAGSLFHEYRFDLTADTAHIFEHGAAELREAMAGVLNRLGIPPQPPHLSAKQAALTTLSFVDNALEELKSKHMRAYGDLTPDVARTLDDEICRLQSAIAHIKKDMKRHSAGNAALGGGQKRQRTHRQVQPTDRDRSRTRSGHRF